MKKPILIVSHDAGGAEIVSAWDHAHPEHQYSYVLGGPAVSIFSNRLGKIDNYSEAELSNLIGMSEEVITSTSWSSDLECKAIKIAKQKKVKVVSYLDHWIHYQERFQLNDAYELPDEMWVGDEYAKSIAETLFPKQKICYVPNEYFKEIRKKCENLSLKNSDGLRILFLTQPLDKVIHYSDALSFTDRDVFDVLLHSLQTLKKKKDIQELRIRLHPADNIEKYETWLNHIKEFPVQISFEKDLLIDCINSDWVVGAFSMAQVIALLAGRKVFSCLPAAMTSLLPHKEIKDLKHYVESL